MASPTATKLSLLALTTAALSLLLAGCSAPVPSISESIESSGDSATLSLAELLPEGAEGLMVVCPYTNLTGLSQELDPNVELKVSERQLPGTDEGSYALLAVSADEISYLSTERRLPLDLCHSEGRATTGTVLSPDETLNLVRAEGDSERWILV